jgi:uncharacterized protein
MKLEMIPGRFAICRLKPDAASRPRSDSPLPLSFFSATRTAEELSVVCLERDAPPEARVEGGWSCFRVAGKLDFGLTGVLAALASPLAEAGVSLFAISTFDTDYVLVKEMARAREALENAGHEFL